MTFNRGLLLGFAAVTVQAQDIQETVQQTVQLALKHVNQNLSFYVPPFAWQGPDVWKRGEPVTQEDEMKIVAIESVMRNDPERAIPLVEKVLRNPQTSVRVRSRALQALARNGSEKAREIVIQIAKDGTNSELQSRAVQLLASREGSQNDKVLSEIYAASSSVDVKKQILRGWMGAGAKENILNVAKSDSNPEVRKFAIRHLGGMRATTELAALYDAETSTEIREEILRGMMSAQDWQKLLQIAKTEKNEELRNRAIQYAGAMRVAGSSDALVQLYESTSEPSTRNAVLRALSQQGSAKQLIALARKETNPELKRSALQHITRMKGDDVTTFLAELLEK